MCRERRIYELSTCNAICDRGDLSNNCDAKEYGGKMTPKQYVTIWLMIMDVVYAAVILGRYL